LPGCLSGKQYYNPNHYFLNSAFIELLYKQWLIFSVLWLTPIVPLLHAIFRRTKMTWEKSTWPW
jgi:uncharacterized membrane protein